MSSSISVSSISLALPTRRTRLSAIRATSSSPPKSTVAVKDGVKKQEEGLSLLKTTLVAATAASAVLLSRLSVPVSAPFLLPLPALAATLQSSHDDDHVTTTALKDDDVTATALKDDDVVGSDDVAELKGKMEAKIKEGKVDEAIGIVERLIKLEPDDMEWPLMRGHLFCYDGNLEMARLGFNEMLKKDPTRVEAFHGLVMAASEGDSGEQLKDIEKRVQEAMEICKKENEKDDLRDFKLLIAQIRVIGGDYNEALKVYQDLVKEEPRDFRPYLCQGIIYTLLKKTDEAEKQFEKYRRLVPKGHPYAQYFDDNMIATKVFGKAENEKAATRS